jgi:hypothetical protein
MENCYERIVELLGTHKDDPLFAKFVEDLGVLPRVFARDAHICTHYHFDLLGIDLNFMADIGCFDQAELTWEAHRRYPWNLLKDIKFEDPIYIVEKKMKDDRTARRVGKVPDELS